MITPLPDTIYTLPLYYKEEYFSGDSLLHTELTVQQAGASTDLLPYELWKDDWVTLILLFAFFALTYLCLHTRRFFIQHLRDFFFEAHERTSNLFAVETSMETHAILFYTLLLSIMGGLMFYGYWREEEDVFLGNLSPYVFLGLFIACWILYFVFRDMLASFVNWVFFDKKDRQLWSEATSFITSAEALTLFPVTIVLIYFNIPSNWGGIALISVIILAKLLRLYKCFHIFFKKMYGSLHLIVYFCALELTPLAAIWVVLTNLNRILI